MSFFLSSSSLGDSLGSCSWLALSKAYSTPVSSLPSSRSSIVLLVPSYYNAISTLSSAGISELFSISVGVSFFFLGYFLRIRLGLSDFSAEAVAPPSSIVDSSLPSGLAS